MVKLAPLLGMLLKASLRQFLTANSRSKQAGGVLLFLVALAFSGSWIDRIDSARYYLEMGEFGRAADVLHLLFLLWVALPFLVRGGGLGLDTLVRLRRLPLTPTQTFLTGIMDLATAPLTWALAAGTVALFPFAQNSPGDGAALFGLLLFVVSCCGAMLSVCHLTLLAACHYKARPLVWFVGLLLIWGYSSFHWFRPEFAAVDALLGRGLGPIAGYALVTAIAAFGSFYLLLQAMRSNVSARPPSSHFTPPPLPGRFGYLLRFGILRNAKSFSFVVGWVVAAGIVTELLGDPRAVAQPYWLALTTVCVLNSALWFNLFGFMDVGLMRIALWPEPGKRLVLLAQACALPITLLPVLPVLAAGWWAFGFATALGGGLLVLGLVLVLALLGSPLSLQDPVPRSSPGSRVSLTNNLPRTGQLVALALFFMLVGMLSHRNNPWQAVGVLAMLDALGLVFYLSTLNNLGRRFEQSGEWFIARVANLAD